MKGRRSVMAFVFIISALIVGSFQVSAQATDPGAAAGSGSGSFADSVPQIPGYNAPYPALATQSSGKALAKPIQSAGTLGDLGPKGPSDGFAAIVPSIPGYNAPYPALAAQTSGKVLAKPIRVTDSPSTSTALSFYGLADGFAASVPQIPGYNAPYPDQASQSPGKVLAKPIQGSDALGNLGSKGPSDGFAVTVPQIPGYNAP